MDLPQSRTNPSMADTIAAPWRQLLITSLQANAHLKHSSYFQLATVTRDGRPANRTVVFRGFLGGSDAIQFTTDSRSSKIEEILNNPRGEICWYFSDTWEQFRIKGVLNIINGFDVDARRLQLREKAWFELSARSRSQFLGPAPRMPLLCTNSMNEPVLDPLQGPPGAFCLVSLDAEEVDYLHLKKNERLIFMHNANGCEGWSQLSVNP